MFDVNGYQIRISRGDTGLLTLRFTGVEMTPEDRVVVTVRRRGGGILKEMTATPDKDGIVQFPFLHDETEHWKPDAYEWDARVVLGAELTDGEVTGGREVITPMPPSEFIVTRTVSEV